MNLKEKLKLKSFVNGLEKIRGRHTELVSVYVPAGYDINKVVNHLKQEQGTAENIKDKTTRLHVIDSLEKMIRHLRLFKKIPENGLALFSGNIASQEGKTDIKIWSIEPPEPLRYRLYRCDHVFVLDYLKEMLEHKDTYGLVVIDNREATIGFLKGTSVVELISLKSDVPGKVHAGGFSQQRYARLREEAAHEFYKKVSDIINKEFSGMKDLKGILIGGPGPTKETFISGDYVHTDLKKKIMGTRDLSYTGEFGLKELVSKSKDLIAELEVSKEREIMKEFFEKLGKSPERVAYGMESVKKVLDYGAVEILLLSESLSDKEIESFEKEAENYNTEVRIISMDTDEGKQLKDLGGIAAILRYAVS
jgi:peptide chain release factor subunit 1